MERNEMIEVLMGKAKVSRKEAEEVLEKYNWDLLDSIIYLERKGKVENNETTTIIEVSKEGEEKSYENDKKHKNRSGGIGTVIGRIFKFIGNIISKGNKKYFEIKKENEKPIKISITISVLLLIIAFWPVVVLLLIGLFLGYKYSVCGMDVNGEKVNEILNKVSDSADSIKDDFKEGYKNAN